MFMTTLFAEQPTKILKWIELKLKKVKRESCWDKHCQKNNFHVFLFWHNTLSEAKFYTIQYMSHCLTQPNCLTFTDTLVEARI